MLLSKTLTLFSILVVSLLLPSAYAATVPIEQTMSSRLSVRQWTNVNITQQQLLSVLHGAYGYWGDHRAVPKVGSDYSFTLFSVNATGSYLYNPLSNALSIYDLSVNKEYLRPRFDQGYPSDASAVIIMVWNQTLMSNQYYASAEAGLIVQNTYLAAISNNLGTVCVALIDSNGLRSDLRLPATMMPLLVMPLGYPASSYPPYSSATPDYTRMHGNLPTVQYGTSSFENAPNNLLYAQNWNGQSLSTQELSQLLWASYGYSSTGHRTTPSADDAYALVIYVSNATGVYKYLPETHSVAIVVQGDKRLALATASGGQTWAANAPALFLVSYDTTFVSTYPADGGIVPHEYIEVDTGTVMQQLLLEATALNMSGNVVSKGLEDWNGAGATALRNILGLPSSQIPLYIVPVGHGGTIPEFSPLLLSFLFVMATFAVVFFKLLGQGRTQRKNLSNSNVARLSAQ